MTPCFADSSYFLAILIPTDVNHAAALHIAKQIRRPVVTSEFVVIEVANFLCAPRSRRKFSRFLASIQQDPNMEIVELASDLLDQGIVLYEARPDKSWSLTDCISFVVMQERGLTDVLTADQHLEQAGFVTLLNNRR